MADQNQQPAQKDGKKKFSQGFMALIERKQKQMQLEQEMANMVAEELKVEAEDTQQPTTKSGNKKFSQGFMALLERKKKQMELEE